MNAKMSGWEKVCIVKRIQWMWRQPHCYLTQSTWARSHSGDKTIQARNRRERESRQDLLGVSKLEQTWHFRACLGNGKKSRGFYGRPAETSYFQNMHLPWQLHTLVNSTFIHLILISTFCIVTLAKARTMPSTKHNGVQSPHFIL